VRRWQVGRTAIAADDDDPGRDQARYVEGLSEPPSYTLQPSWAVCGPACARKIIEEDQAQPHKGSHVTGRTEFYYEVESWRYLPHDSELPRALVRLRAHTDQIDYLREQLERAFAGADAASAALDLADLRRRVARTAADRRSARTRPPPAPSGPVTGSRTTSARSGTETPSTANGLSSAAAGKIAGRGPAGSGTPGTS
jgi:hypothetical protein